MTIAVDKGTPFERNEREFRNDQRQLERWKRDLPEYKNKKDEQEEEHGDVVQGPQHDHELPSQSRHEADEFEYPEQTKRTQHGQATAAFFLHQLHHARRWKESGEREQNEN